MEIKSCRLSGVNSRGLLLGVEKENEEHGVFISDVMRSMDFDCVVSEISPDCGMWIKSES